MMKLNYRISSKEGKVFEDTASFEGALHLVVPFENETVEEIKAVVQLNVSDEEKIFMNGYQTWTTCPEYTKDDRIRGLHNIPRPLIRRFAFDGYSDYHFTEYPYTKGILHGWSWCYFRRGGFYRLFASLSEKNGYTEFVYNDSEGTLTIRKDAEGLKADGDFEALNLYYAEGSEQQVFDSWFEMMDIHPITDKKLYGYSSWYNRYQNIDEYAIEEDLKGCTSIFEKGDLFQVDDGWEPFVGDWLECDSSKFPSGMKTIADHIHENGFEAGLWLAPFAAEEKSSVYREHPDWLIRNEDGSYFKAGSNWSGFYCLDIDNPEVIAYLEDVFHRVFDEWGFDLVKLDFLYAAAPYGSEKETRADRMIRAVDLLRRLCGKHPILGCGVPVMPAFGKFEYCRISCDVTLDWDDKAYMHMIHRERPSTKNAVANILSRRALNGRAYLSDPDVFFLRTENCQLSQKQKYSLAVLDALCGGVFLTSDDPGSYTKEMKEQYRLYRSLTKATNVQIMNDRGITAVYDLDDETTRRRLF